MAQPATIIASAPGSLMLLGEHAVLHGHHALVGAINRRITVELIPADDEYIEIVSALGAYKTPITNLVDHSSFRFVLQAVRQYSEQMVSGCKLNIESEFSADIGFGSSAAVTVATHAALQQWLSVEAPSPERIFAESLKTVLQVQGRGSGADLAASIYGGAVQYTIAPTFHSVPISVPITAIYCGYKTPTPEVIETVEGYRAADPDKFDCIYSDMDQSALEAVAALEQCDFPAFGAIVNHNQELMQALGLATPELSEIIDGLQQEPDIFGAKISGSGLGDCAIGIGYAEMNDLEYPVYHVEIDPVGVSIS